MGHVWRSVNTHTYAQDTTAMHPVHTPGRGPDSLCTTQLCKTSLSEADGSITPQSFWASGSRETFSLSLHTPTNVVHWLILDSTHWPFYNLKGWPTFDFHGVNKIDSMNLNCKFISILTNQFRTSESLKNHTMAFQHLITTTFYILQLN